MPITYADARPAAFGHQMIHFGETIAYTPKGGAERTITAMVHRQSFRDIQSGETLRWESIGRVTIYADDDNGVADPDTGDKVSFDGVDHRVVDVADRDSVSACLIVKRTGKTHSGAVREA